MRCVGALETRLAKVDMGDGMDLNQKLGLCFLSSTMR